MGGPSLFQSLRGRVRKGRLRNGRTTPRCISTPVPTEVHEPLKAADACISAGSSMLLSSSVGSGSPRVTTESLNAKLVEVGGRLAEVKALSAELYGARSPSRLAETEGTQSSVKLRRGLRSAPSSGLASLGLELSRPHTTPTPPTRLLSVPSTPPTRPHSTAGPPVRRRRPVVADAAEEQQWASSLFKELPSIRRSYEEQSTGMRLSRSAPSMFPPTPGDNLVKSPQNRLAVWADLNSQDGLGGETDKNDMFACELLHYSINEHDHRLLHYFPEKNSTLSLTRPLTSPAAVVLPMSRQTSALAGSQRNSPRPPLKARTSPRPPSKTPVLKARASFVSSVGTDSDEGEAQPSARGFTCLATLALRWKIPLDTVKASSELFKEHAVMPSKKRATKDVFCILKEGVLHVDELKMVLCDMTECESLDELPEHAVQQMLQTTTQTSDGSLDFEAFATWYHQRSFCEHCCLSKRERKGRDVAHQLGMPVAEAEHCKKLFDKFDVDGNGHLSYPEFRDFVNSLIGHRSADSRKQHDLPESRVQHFWKLCDLNGNGSVEFQEFAIFYKQHFDTDSFDPGETFYNVKRPGRAR